MTEYLKHIQENSPYNDEPVLYCKHCLSLNIQNALSDYCEDCGSIDVGECNIFEWEKMYEEKYGKPYRS